MEYQQQQQQRRKQYHQQYRSRCFFESKSMA
ncbi:hypothetical protein COLO4_28159 [Corchorus olitorius]|uniref:Uncharacterized protein n=1 Tax=Corchorus olitorius TaxID=93759 RepID=A0A1R3HMX7_9ROSI|nr:hypothetical protein COLO4_28159 [Corchorus olitorius]